MWPNDIDLVFFPVAPLNVDLPVFKILRKKCLNVFYREPVPEIVEELLWKYVILCPSLVLERSFRLQPSCIQYECEKIGTRKNSVFGHT